ncbi:MAG: hypothetical protein U9N72_11570 [Bacteroidota bacterium]|nr:hypothetical protein [Bacteroidota bacterium]
MTTDINALGTFDASPGHLLVASYMGFRETAGLTEYDLNTQSHQGYCNKYEA